ncbi:hypothetical protein J6590_058092 [Homalodisca vitripennis]|nr:hypothetical protein J6590_058092 [Homalodisca vitripennis]
MASGIGREFPNDPSTTCYAEVLSRCRLDCARKQARVDVHACCRSPDVFNIRLQVELMARVFGKCKMQHARVDTPGGGRLGNLHGAMLRYDLVCDVELRGCQASASSCSLLRLDVPHCRCNQE